jgi:hypothetical protein
VLERAIVLQAQGAWKESARDLSAAENELELLDFNVDAVGTIGTYIYSDSAGEYTHAAARARRAQRRQHAQLPLADRPQGARSRRAATR